MRKLLNFRVVCLGFLGAVCFLGLAPLPFAHGETVSSYVGKEVCKGCHEKEYKSFIAYSKKNSSFKSIALRRKKLTDEEFKTCLSCHTTGYGKPGGFKSEAETPDMKDLNCEACHGPGSEHAKSGNPKDLKGKMTAGDCETCHNADRVATFNYKPLIYGGAH